MAENIRRVRCELCGKYMLWVPGSGRYIPIEVVLYLDFNGTQKALFYYECPCEHACAWFIPTYGEEKELVFKRHFRRPLDEVLP